MISHSFINPSRSRLHKCPGKAKIILIDTLITQIITFNFSIVNNKLQVAVVTKRIISTFIKFNTRYRSKTTVRISKLFKL